MYTKRRMFLPTGIVSKLEVLSYRLYLLLTTTYSTLIASTKRWIVFDTMADLKSLMYLGIRIDQTPASPCNSNGLPDQVRDGGAAPSSSTL
jgi:hypothetical protein